MQVEDLKYGEEINVLLENGVQLPSLYDITSKHAYRYVFSSENTNNHKPVYMQKPRRVISDTKKGCLSTSGYALSCFEDEHKAIKKYDLLKATCKNIKLSIGDALSYGVLDENDGLVTVSNDEYHYDLYEFHNCDLSTKLIVKQSLV